MAKQISGITLIALVITIIVILILAGIAINTLLGENGLINKTVSASIAQEIAGEKEIISLSYSAVAIDNATGSGAMELIEGEENRESLEKEIKNSGHSGATVESIEKEGYLFKITFETGRSYYLAANGNCIEDDKEASVGDTEELLKQGDNLEYLIYKIEDLVELSNRSNSGEEGIYGSTCVLQNDLNFLDKSSYYNSETKRFGDLNGDGKIKTLMEELTEHTDTHNAGFIPIGFANSEHSIAFEGNNHKIENIYIKSSEYEYVGLFGENGSGYIGNLTLSGDIYVNNNNLDSDHVSIGAMAGYCGSIENCTNIVNITVELNSENSIYTYLGGVAGEARSSYNNLNKGNIVAKNVYSSYISGVTSTFSNQFIDVDLCNNEGTITVEGNNNSVCGIAYLVGGDYDTARYNKGKISIKGDNNSISGIGLYISGNMINDADIYIDGNSNYCGGIIGNSMIISFDYDLSASNLVNYGNISISENSRDNIIGGMASYGIIDANMSNFGTIPNNENNICGGIFGEVDGISFGYSLAHTITNNNGQKCVGRFSYSGDGTVNHAYDSQGVTCIFCGVECSHNTWMPNEFGNETCSICGYVCYHENTWDSFTGVCHVCGQQCQHEFYDGYCSICGYQCLHEYGLSDGYCSICGYCCMHETTYEQDGYTYCSICNQQISW